VFRSINLAVYDPWVSDSGGEKAPPSTSPSADSVTEERDKDGHP